MTKTLYLHVGAPKSGTTYLQRVLEANRSVLADAGVLVVGDNHLDRIHAAMVVREDPRLAKLGPQANNAWQRLVKQVRDWSGAKAILSYELFAGADADQVEKALKDLGGIDVHVVVTARDFARAVPSAWQERLKFALTTGLEEWKPRPESAGPRAEWGWRTMDPAGVARRWGRRLPAAHVHIVTVPRAGADKDELWRRFAAACDLDVPGLSTDVERVNESMGVVAAELLRRVNEKVEDPISNNREHALWLRDTLAHQVLVTLGNEPIGLTDAQYDDAATRSEESINQVRSAGYDVQGDLEDLRATRPEARTPSEVTEGELLDAATQTIVKLIVLMRERTGGATEAPEQGAKGLGSFGKRVLRGGAAVQLGKETERLEERVKALEAELFAQRALQLRVAELTDLVTELLLPAGDAEVSEAALARYRGESL
ncbi:MAG TPA: DUF6752 domain-containing protein [Nocardioidaceae bacterium]|nr:DUF6752 domain-containing protein [Nocardioidaceae bacterium]